MVKRCFDVIQEHQVACNRNQCPQWIDHPARQNCTVIAIREDEEHTFAQIAPIFKMTRMRICQIEMKIKSRLATELEYLKDSNYESS